MNQWIEIFFDLTKQREKKNDENQKKYKMKDITDMIDTNIFSNNFISRDNVIRRKRNVCNDLKRRNMRDKNAKTTESSLLRTSLSLDQFHFLWFSSIHRRIVEIHLQHFHVDWPRLMNQDWQKHNLLDY